MHLPKPDGAPYALCPAGTHVAVCYRFIDLGTQRYEHPGGPKDQRKVMLSWELPEVLIAEGDFTGEPFTYHQQYTWSMNENATLRKHLESWRGIPFTEEDFGEDGCDIRDVLGKPCMLTLTHTRSGTRTYVRLQTISRLLKGKQAPDKPRNSIEYFSLEGSSIDLLTLSHLSDKLQAMISKTPEYERLMRPVPVSSFNLIHFDCGKPFNRTRLLTGQDPRSLANAPGLIVKSRGALSLNETRPSYTP